MAKEPLQMPSDEALLRMIKDMERFHEERLERFFQLYVSPMIDAMTEGVAYREVLLDTVFQHWFESRIVNREQLFHSNDQDINLAAGEVFFEYVDITKQRVGREVVPFIEHMWMMHHILAQVYDIPYLRQQGMTATHAEDYVRLMGTTEQVLTEPEYKERLLQEAEVLTTYSDQFVAFVSQYAEPLQQLAQEIHTSIRGTTYSMVFNILLEDMYDFDPRNRKKWEEIEASAGPIGKLIHTIRMRMEFNMVTKLIEEYKNASVIQGKI